MNDDLPLAAEFPPATREDWLKLVRAALKDRPYERLISKTYDDLAIEPLYDRAAEARPLSARQGRWQVMSRVELPDPATANDEALHELANGATGLSLVFKGSVGDYGFGLEASKATLARVLDGIHLEAGISIELQTAEVSKEAADHLVALVRERGLVPENLDIRFGHDPIGAHAIHGASPIPWSELAPRFAAHVGELAALGFKGPLTVADGRVIHNAGGSEAQELAYVLSVAVAYLRALDGAGVALDDARRMIAFRLAADADQFLTIGKFRALRKLWARVEQACGLDPRPAFVAAETAWRMMTRHDPWVNMLRVTIAAFSAGVAGANAVTVLPFTAALGLPDRFARRIARNTQILLIEESNLARVADPAAGSGGIEDLTEKLCGAAWTLFQEIEKAGGASAALQAGLIQQKVAAVRAQREAAVAHRKDALTGTSDFPNLTEAPVVVLSGKPQAAPSYSAAITYPPLARMRLAEPFEQLRDISDRHHTATGTRPRIFLANLGMAADFNARATFAKNFFEAGGIEAVTNDGFATREEMLSAFKASGAQLACLCSSDEAYGREAAEAARALASAGAKHVYLAGRPRDPAPYQAAGVGTFIFAGCDAVATLRNAHSIIAG
jgi:methylmalonyl-CoA mutase